MAKIFRKKRQSSLSENKTTNYLKYAVGEILLVVIGILIAIQINNWNQSVKDENTLNEYLVKIKTHTQEDLQQLEELTRGRGQILQICQQARLSMLNKTEEDNLFLFMTSGLAFADFYFKPNSGGYEALKISGYFGKINNTTLDSLLAKYHGLVESIAENEKSYNEYMVAQEIHLDAQFDRSLILASAFITPDSLSKLATPQSEYDEAFKAYTSGAPYRNVISLASFQFGAMIDQYKELTELGNSVLEEIDGRTNAISQ